MQKCAIIHESPRRTKVLYDNIMKYMKKLADACAQLFHLQPIWAIITQSGDVQQIVQATVQFLTLHCGAQCLKTRGNCIGMRRRRC